MRKLYRSNKDKWIAGIIGGLGEYLGIDATILRVAFIIFALATGGFPGIVGYILAIIIIPKAPLGYEPAPAAATAESARPASAPASAGPAPQSQTPARNGNAALVVGVVLIGLGVLFLFNNFIDIRWHLLWPVVLILLGLVLLGKVLFNGKGL